MVIRCSSYHSCVTNYPKSVIPHYSLGQECRQGLASYSIPWNTDWGHSVALRGWLRWSGESRMASHTACASWQGWLEGWTQLGLLTAPSKMAFPTWQFLGSKNSTMATGFPQSTCPNRIRQKLHGP